jgi:DNA-binding Lrp family transcriptional regulator
MAIGFVLITTETAHEREVFKSLSKLPEIVELHPLFGEYDFIAKIKADDFDSLGVMVVKKIRSIDGVRFTTTLTGLMF